MSVGNVWNQGGGLSSPAAREDWATPRTLFEMLNKEFHFTLDVCATAETATCYEYFDSGYPLVSPLHPQQGRDPVLGGTAVL
jgi:hypothetical protein